MKLSSHSFDQLLAVFMTLFLFAVPEAAVAAVAEVAAVLVAVVAVAAVAAVAAAVVVLAATVTLAVAVVTAFAAVVAVAVAVAVVGRQQPDCHLEYHYRPSFHACSRSSLHGKKGTGLFPDLLI